MNDHSEKMGKKIDQLISDAGHLTESVRKEAEKLNESEGTQNNPKETKNEDKKKQDEPEKKIKNNADIKPLKADSEQETKSKKKWYIFGGIAGVFVTLAALYIVFSLPLSNAKKEQLYANGAFVKGVSIFGIDVSGNTIKEAREKLSDKVNSTGDGVLLELKLKDNIIPVKASDLQVGSTVDSVLKEAMLFGRQGNLFKKLMDKRQGKNFNVGIYTDDVSLQNLVNTIVSKYSIAAKDADVELNLNGQEKFTYIPEQVGYEIVPDGLGEKIKNHIQTNAAGYVELDYVETQPKITVEKLKENMVLRSSYSTNVSGETGRRKNVIMAAEKINGKKVMPGQSFNIENELGPRTKANGWNIGGEFVNGELVNGYGGGICQTSTTLFNAVIRGDLEVVERSNHSQTVGYVPLGFDASISSGGPYFIFKNNTDYPMYIISYATMSKVTVELYGSPLPYGDNITYEEKVSATGTVSSGRKVQSTLVFYKDGNEVHRISWSSSYRGKPVTITTTQSTAATTTAATTATTSATKVTVSTDKTTASTTATTATTNESATNSTSKPTTTTKAE